MKIANKTEELLKPDQLHVQMNVYTVCRE